MPNNSKVKGNKQPVLLQGILQQRFPQQHQGKYTKNTPYLTDCTLHKNPEEKKALEICYNKSTTCKFYSKLHSFRIKRIKLTSLVNNVFVSKSNLMVIQWAKKSTFYIHVKYF